MFLLIGHFGEDSVNFPLNIPTEKRRVFLDYFRANLRATGQTPLSGEARYRPNGGLETSISGPFLIKDEEKIPLKWTFHIAPDGKLEGIEVLSLDSNNEEPIWRESVNSFVLAVLSSALGENRQKYFRRNLFCYVGRPLDGEYWLQGPPKFRFAPLDPSENELYWNYERIVCFDMEIEAIDEENASLLADEKTRRFASRLSLFLDHDLYNLSKIPIENVWVIPFDSGKTPPENSHRYQRGLIFKTPSPPVTIPNKGELCNLGTYTGPFWEEGFFTPGSLKLPQNTREILRSIENAGPQFEDAFDRCARMYHVSLANRRRFPSVALAYKIAALEALAIKTEGYTKFKDFINQSFDEETIKIIDSIYGDVRCAHFHAGSFPMGEFDYTTLWEPIIDKGIVEQNELFRKVDFITQNIIASILKRLVDFYGSKN